METSDRAGETEFDKASIIKEYMRELANKSVKAQKKKYGYKEYHKLKKEAGKKAGEVHKQKALDRARKLLEDQGEAFVGKVE
jgi:hypothetical protein